SSVGGGLTWFDLTDSATVTANKGFIITTGSLTVGLPTSSAFGDALSVALNGGDLVTIAQDAGQSIRFGSTVTTLGTGGSLASTSQGDVLNLICTQADTSWMVISGQGNWSVV